MNQLWRDALHAIGAEGADHDQLREAEISDQLLQHLLVAGLLRVDRLNHLENYGALVTQPARTVSSYMLTETGAEAIGLGPESDA